MSFIGKEYKFVSQENFEEYVKAIALPEPEASQYIKYQPNLRLEKNGDTYTFYSIAPQFSRDITFKSGEEVEETNDRYTAKITFTVDGNNVSKVQKFADGIVFTTKKEYSGDSMVETLTASQWDGAAKRFYKASN